MKFVCQLYSGEYKSNYIYTKSDKYKDIHLLKLQGFSYKGKKRSKKNIETKYFEIDMMYYYVIHNIKC